MKALYSAISMLMAAYILLTGVVVNSAYSYDLPLYTINLNFDHKSNIISGSAIIDFKNNYDATLKDVYLFLYPNSHLTESPFLNDVNYEWVYPSNFDPGWMEIDSVSAGENELEFKYGNEEEPDKRIFLQVTLDKELKSTEETSIKIDYRVKVPAKFGPFGHYRERLLLNGGFYPYLVPFDGNGWHFRSNPQRAAFELNLRKGKGDFFVNGIHVGKLGKDDSKYEYLSYCAGPTDYLSLFNSRRTHDTVHVKDKNLEIDITTFRKRWTVQRHLIKNARLFTDFVSSRPELSAGRFRFSVMEAYLRDRLVQPSQNVLYVSDRAFKVFPPLRDYHAVSVIRGMFYQLLQQMISKREKDDLDWVLNTLSWHYVEEYIRHRIAGMKRDARKLSIVKAFSFLQQLDQVIYAPQFSFTNAFYDKIYTWDLFRLDILDYNTKVRSKRVVFEKFKDRYSRQKDMDSFYRGYLEGTANFREYSEQTVGDESEKIIDQWLGPYPKLNYSLEKIKRKKLRGGAYDNKILLKKESDGEVYFDKKIDIFTEQWGGKKEFLTWDTEKDGLDLRTERRLRTVHIDPRGRLLEYKRGDNRFPVLYKWVLTSSAFGVDINDSSPTFSFTTQFRRIYGSYNRYTFSGYRESSSYGASVGYTRLFGRLLDSLRFSHGLALSYRINGLSNPYAVLVPGLEDPSSQEQVITINESGMSTSLLFQYFFGSQYSYTNPKEGMGTTIFAELAGKYLGGDFDYFRAGFSMSGVLPFNQSHFVAWRFKMGFSGRSGIPAQMQYYLGGINNMRGFASGELNRIGRNRILLGAEYRHYLMRDIDLNIFSLFRVRDIMGGLFFNTGRVSATVEEYALARARGESFHKSPHHLFNIKMYDADFGYGIKFVHHILGVKPAILALDVAKSITDFRENGLRYYITFNHYF